MIHVEMTREEIQMLVELLDCSISDLRTEIRQTDNRDYRLMLQQRETLMKKMHTNLAERIVLYEPAI